MWKSVFAVKANVKQQEIKEMVAASSIINEGIRAFLNLLIFFFHKKISHAQKAQNAYKQTKTKKTAFLCA